MKNSKIQELKNLSLGWLVVAAALTFSACSDSDDTLTDKPQQPTQSATKIHVTVGAGISDATTRSEVDYTNSKRTLKFTTGDRLYVWGNYGSMVATPSGVEYYPCIVVGYLDLNTESFDPNNPTTATFTGDLTVYRWVDEVGHYEEDVIHHEAEGHEEPTGEYDEYGDPIYDWVEDVAEWDEEIQRYVLDEDGYYEIVSPSGIFQTSDPLSECNGVTGTLIHEDAVEGTDFVLDNNYQVIYASKCAESVEALMAKGLKVSGNYNAGTKSFPLTTEGTQPILNCTISGLTDGASYKVDYLNGATKEMDNTKTIAVSSSPMRATGGTLSFAFFAKAGDLYHAIRLTNTINSSDVQEVNLGQKSFTSKVYNATKTATPVQQIIYFAPLGYKIEDGAISEWLRNKCFTQGDINALGNDNAADDYFSECYIYNCDFTVPGAGFVELSVTNITRDDDDNIKTVTVKLTRKAPLGLINFNLYLFADGNTQPIDDTNVEFDDPWFDIAPTTGTVTQTTTGTFNIDIKAQSIRAEIRPPFVNEPEEF